MRSKRTPGGSLLQRAGLCVAAVAGAVLTPAGPATGAPAQESYDGYLEETNAWGIEELNAEAAWQTTRGEGATVAVIDSGMSEHPFFDDKDVLPGYSTLVNEDDAWYDVAGDPDDPQDKRGHGTGVAAMALLVAPESTILPVRHSVGIDDGFSNLGEGEVQYEAIRWAVDNGADVIVMAWGLCCTEASEDFYMAMQYAVDHDVVLVAAAGNDPEHVTGWHFPASAPGVVTVSGLGDDGGPWEASTTGPEVDVAGPADYSLAWPVPQSTPYDDDCTWCEDDRVVTADPYQLAGGTSSAVGWVGGAVALIRSAHPDLDADGAIQRLLQTADDRGAEGRDDVFGHGVPDTAAAISADVEPVDRNPLGYPLAVPGASGETATGEPAPGTGATAHGASGTEGDGGGSDVLPLVAIAVLAAALAGGTWFLLQRRSSRPPAGAAGPRPVAPGPSRATVVIVTVVALVAASGTYVAADVVVDTTDAADATDAGTGGPAEDDAPDGDGAADGGAANGGTDGGGTDGGTADPEGELAADGNPAAIAAQTWQNAYTAGDLETFRSMTCENPWYRVVMNRMKLEDPSFVRPGFALLVEDDEGWEADDYRLARQSDGKAWVEAGNLSIGVNPEYEIALVLEDGEWKVCDFWLTGPWWGGVPEWEERWPRGDDDEMNPIPT